MLNICSIFRVRSLSIISLIVGIVILVSGCSKPDTTYKMPEDIYTISLETTAFAPKVRKFTDSPIKYGSNLIPDDFQLKVNDNLILRLGEPIDCNLLELVNTFEYTKGTVFEYKEPSGNYKVLVTEYEEQYYLLAVLTISKYIPTGRGVRNGLTAAELDVLFGNNIFKVETKASQENRIYSYDNMSIIVTLKYDVVRSIQLITTNY